MYYHDGIGDAGRMWSGQQSFGKKWIGGNGNHILEMCIRDRIMTDGGPNGKTEVFLNYMYKQAYGNGAYGYGMAIGVVVFIFSFVLAAIVNKITDREVYEM